MLSRILLGSLLAMSGGRCEPGGKGPSTAPECNGNQDPACDDGGSSGTPEAGTEPATGSGDTAGTAESSAADDPLFSELPAYDHLGAHWIYLDDASGYEMDCRVEELDTWSDGAVRARRACVLEGGTIVIDSQFAIFADRIERRAERDLMYDPFADLFRIPLFEGDGWELNWSLGGGSETTESWTILGKESVDVRAGRFDAVKVEILTVSAAGSSTRSEWWADGIGLVRYESDSGGLELVLFEG